jgi:uncharacterized protein YjiS (DUF1127 family)
MAVIGKLSDGLPSSRAISSARRGGVGRILDVLTAWSQRWRQRTALAEMEPHIREDLALSLSDIDRECGKPFWRK